MLVEIGVSTVVVICGMCVGDEVVMVMVVLMMMVKRSSPTSIYKPLFRCISPHSLDVHQQDGQLAQS